MESGTFPTDDMALTHILVVGDVARAQRFYQDVLGAKLHREYSGSAVLRFQGAWLLLVVGGPPTEDKPGVVFAAPEPDRVSHAMTIRVPDCRAAYDTLRSRGASFLTPPVAHGAETRAFCRDPDGHLIEISSVS